MNKDWFRSQEFSASAMGNFEARLNRARPSSRPQYLRIKAVSLAELNSPEADATAIRLLRRIVDEYPNDWAEVSFAHEKLGYIHRRHGNFAEAEREYRIVVDSYKRSRSGTSGVCDLTLAELIIETKQTAKYIEAASLLTSAAESHSILFANDWYRYWVAAARLANATGQAEDAADFARKALARVAIGRPTFTRHPTVGLVKASLDTLNEMKMLVDCGQTKQ